MPQTHSWAPIARSTVMVPSSSTVAISAHRCGVSAPEVGEVVGVLLGSRVLDAVEAWRGAGNDEWPNLVGVLSARDEQVRRVCGHQFEGDSGVLRPIRRHEGDVRRVLGMQVGQRDQ